MMRKLWVGLLLALYTLRSQGQTASALLPGLATAPVAVLASAAATPLALAPIEEWQTVFFESSATTLPLLTAAAVQHSAQMKTLELEKSINQQDIRLARNSILSSLALSGSYSYGNMASIALVDPNNPNQLTTYSSSRYSTGVNFALPLDRIVSRNILIRREELSYQRSESLRQEREGFIRQQVIQYYQNVLVSKKLLTLRQEAYVTLYTNYQLAEQQFRQGQLSLPALSLASGPLMELAVAQAPAGTQYDTAFMLLEEVVGARISSLLTAAR